MLPTTIMILYVYLAKYDAACTAYRHAFLTSNSPTIEFTIKREFKTKGMDLLETCEPYWYRSAGI